MEYIAQKESDLIHICQQFLEDWSEYKVFAFRGEMGAGKTTFISYLVRAMGVNEEVSSPTYGYVNEYKSPYFGTIYHFDLYRLDSEKDAYDIGIEEYIYDEKNIVLIEWAEKIENLLPDNHVWVNIHVNEKEHRIISLEPNDRS